MDDAANNLPAYGHSTNLVGLPTGLLASVAFNDFPLPLHISGVREMNGALYRMLAEATNMEECAEVFRCYMEAVFALDDKPEQTDRPRKRRFHSSYLKLLEGWGFDSNSPAGAVLKGWTESRFGLLPIYHKEKLGRYPSQPWITYVEEKMSSRFHNNSINQQLDLLYEFCQWVITHMAYHGKRHLTLYRGVNDFAEHQCLYSIDKREMVMRQNNVVSFTSSRERADEFGDTILEAQVPLVKVLYFNGLLPRNVLKGEGEFLVIGGEYRVKTSYW
ncbi:MAG: NAD(+)--dinitrogen-reductase ADP-D-ribosyltransferase [Gallionellales bacterium GWA2_60_18]|nr:MAG: NAD(+)--dinitrogen-reductase ADP-D-ribosyltransferase [Gallionellales bacterium GWA2_60_18]